MAASVIYEPKEKSQITLAVLAGGRGSRMHGYDKGWLLIHDRPLIHWITAALRPHVQTIVICANRNIVEYGAYATVLPDNPVGFLGPLAGIATALEYCSTPWLFTLPVDCPHPMPELLSRLYTTVKISNAPGAVARDTRRQPLFALYRSDLALSARAALAANQGVWQWQEQEGLTLVDCMDLAPTFINLNTLEDLRRYENRPLA